VAQVDRDAVPNALHGPADTDVQQDKDHGPQPEAHNGYER